MNKEAIQILGINFFNGDEKHALEKLKQGGLLMAPAAPALVNIKNDKSYYNALLKADIVIADSGYMSLLWNLSHKNKIRRLSGIEFLDALFSDFSIVEESDIFLVDPRQKEVVANLAYLRKAGFNVEDDISYCAPFYDKKNIEDPDLLKILEHKKPKYIIINLGGGVQEQLGAYLKANLSYKPAIVCTGAAIAILTGEQVRIPFWALKFHMGWLYRCFSNPKLYVKRYMSAFKLAGVMVRYGKNGPAFV